MISFDDFKRLIEPLRRKVFLMVGRAILEAVNANDDPTQKVQITMLANETITDVERCQDFGFDSYPVVGTAEPIVICPNGNRDQALVVCIQDRDLRPIDGEEGESIMYSANDKEDVHRIHLKADGSIEIIGKASDQSIILKADGSIEIIGEASDQSIILKADGSIENLSGTSKIINNSGKVALGTSSAEVLDLFEQTLTGIEALTVPTAVGPSGVPINAATFTTIKTSLTGIKGTI